MTLDRFYQLNSLDFTSCRKEIIILSRKNFDVYAFSYVSAKGIVAVMKNYTDDYIIFGFSGEDGREPVYRNGYDTFHVDGIIVPPKGCYEVPNNDLGLTQMKAILDGRYAVVKRKRHGEVTLKW